jgi:hypothetical protein
MRYLLFSSSILLLSCASDYRNLTAIPVDINCIAKIAPRPLSTSWYHASVEVAGNHISGLLLIKNMPDSAIRVVFTNEAGVTFFDFGFSKDRTFTVHAIIKKLNKKPVVQTLRKDFELMLALPFVKTSYLSWREGEEVYFGVKQKKQTAYFIISKDCSSLHRLEWGDARKRKVTVRLVGSGYPSPEKLELIHHTFDMRISLTRFQKE